MTHLCDAELVAVSRSLWAPRFFTTDGIFRFQL